MNKILLFVYCKLSGKDYVIERQKELSRELYKFWSKAQVKEYIVVSQYNRALHTMQEVKQFCSEICAYNIGKSIGSKRGLWYATATLNRR